MVGAGFSLNAEPLPGVKRTFPAWRELAHFMFDRLHPSRPDESPQERETRFNGASPLRIASEFEAAFGLGKLEHLVRTEVPDANHRPGSLHRQLLQLPWADVFTTNYDTLLERTEVDGRTYQPVYRASDLTTAFTPRIVKLHGSLPSHTPFIVTEEDYRTYPHKFAPFVNSVRQSLLENSFVLVGFSGNDPNFLEWTGWIRDELGENHAPIYLVGALRLADPERSLIVRRGVTPIDLTPLCADTHDSELQRVAMEQLLGFLASRRPPRPEKWPDFRRQSPTGIHPLLASPWRDTPEPVAPGLASRKLTPETLAGLIERWRFERSEYPGWIVAPEPKRSELWNTTKYWIDRLLVSVQEYTAADRLIAFREITWRLDTVMAPLLANLVAPFEKALDDLLEELIAGTPLHLSASFGVDQRAAGSEIADAWFDVAFSLLRDARESYDAVRWTAIKSKIDRLAPQHPKQRDREEYQKALWAVWNVDRQLARKFLSEWHSPQSPIAQIWKASLLAELDEAAEAKAVLGSALVEIRKALRSQGQNIELLSLEGWCTYLIAAVEEALNLIQGSDARDEFWERWEELKAWDCSPWPYKEYFDQALSTPPPEVPKPVEEVRGFDPDEVTRSLRLFGDTLDPLLPSFACIRLFERVGLPLRVHAIGSVGGLDVAGDCLTNACRWVEPYTGFWSPALLIRAAKIDDLTKNGFLTRTRVATMDAALAQGIHTWSLQILLREMAPPAGATSDAHTQGRLIEVSIEVLSRLAFRLDSAGLRASFPTAIRCYTMPVASARLGIHEACMRWFQRLFEAADDELLLEWLPELIRLPLPDNGLDPVLQMPSSWPDPIRHYPFDRVRALAASRPDLAAKVKDATAWLFRRAAGESGTLRRWTVLRLVRVCRGGWMPADQERQFGELLWSARSPNGLPDIQSLSIPVLLDLPAPADVDVVSVVKDYILNLTAAGSVTRAAQGISAAFGGPPIPLLYDALHVSEPPLRLGGEIRQYIEWTPDEAKRLFHKALAWWGNDKAALEVMYPSPGADTVLQNLRLMGRFLTRVVVPRIDSADEVEWQRLVALLNEARGFGAYLTEVLPYMLLRRPADAETTAMMISDDLYSGVEEAVCAAAGAVRRWVHLSRTGRVPPPPGVPLARLIERVVFRRSPGLAACLRHLASLVAKIPDALDDEQAALLTASLVPWQHATALSLKDAPSGEFAEADRPDLQTSVAMLAGALSLRPRKLAPETAEPISIAAWRDLCASSSLPEVRRAFGCTAGPAGGVLS